jgi:hypothetical protein
LSWAGLDFWPRFVLAALATWRATHLLAREDGPFNSVARLRAWLGAGVLGQLLDCVYCLSLWVAAPLSVVVTSSPFSWLLVCPALSAAACLLERFGQEPAIVHQISEHNPGDTNGVLRSESSPSFDPDDESGARTESEDFARHGGARRS